MTGGVVAKRQLGQALRALRERARLDRAAAARVLDCSVGKIGKIELGEVGVRATELRVLLDLYEVSDPDRTDLELLGQQSRQRRRRTSYGPAVPDWFRRFASLEEVAAEIKSYQADVIPGVMQIEDYARALTMASPLRPPGDVDRLVAARLARQERLTGDDPVRMSVILGEAAVRNEIGGPDVLQRQLAHLRVLAERPNITIQVAPFSGGAHAASGFSFVLLKLASDSLDVVYLEDLTSARYIDNDAVEQQRYGIVWNALRLSAMTPDESTRLLDTLVKYREHT